MRVRAISDVFKRKRSQTERLSNVETASRGVSRRAFGPLRRQHGPCMPSVRELALSLPDVPRWVEARHYLLSGTCEIYGLAREPELSLVVRDPATGFLVVIGAPAASAIQTAARELFDGSNLIVAPEHAALVADALPEWRSARVFVHVLRFPERLPAPSAADVRFIDIRIMREESLPEDLRREIAIGAEKSPIAATFVDGHPVSFCYAGSSTESLWDISIDTLEEHRRRGHAAHCVAYMIRHMQTLAKEPVWAAVEENPASWRLAEKLGFERVDELMLFEPPQA